MDDEKLASENARAGLAKLIFEFQEQRSWRWKILFTSIVAPFGSVILLLVGWYGSHVAERRHQMEDVYSRAAKELENHDPSVRLSAVKTLDQYIVGSDASWLARVSERIFTTHTGRELADERSRETMSILVGSLWRETDPAVLDAIADATEHHPQEAAQPVISMNKTAVAVFVRAAGEFAGLSLLHKHRARALQEDGLTDADKDEAISDIDTVVLRTGSPFQASTRYNPRFSPRDILVNGKTCQFNEIYDNRRTLTMGSDLNTITRSKAPNLKELKAAMDSVMSSAATLERSSYILGRLIDKHRGIFERRNGFKVESNQDAGEQDLSLFGTAVIVGKPDDPTAIDFLRKSGGYYNSPDYYDKNPGCQ